MKGKFTYRQGDVLLIKIEELPENVKKAQGCTLALGEVTGHHHTIHQETATMYENGIDKWVVVEDGADAVLTHQEHADIVVAPGVYGVIIQREYSEAENRRVLD